MANLHQSGEEIIQRSFFADDALTKPSTVQVGLYNTSDSLSDSSDVGDITTEASGSAYSRQSVSLDSTGFDVAVSGSNIVASGSSSIIFDITDDTASFDGYFIVANYQRLGEGASNDHLITTGNLTQSRDASQINKLELQEYGGQLEND